MAAVPGITHRKPVYSQEPLFGLTVDQYHDLIERGKFNDDDPVELIEGLLVFKMPKNPIHAYVVAVLLDLISKLLGSQWQYRSQEPVTLSDGEPEPDGVIARGSRRDYLSRHPYPSDVPLVIEVSDTTLKRDQGMKLRSYARAGIGCYWIVNLVDRQVEVYTRPESSATEPRYLDCQIFKPGKFLPLIIDGRELGELAVADILPA